MKTFAVAEWERNKTGDNILQQLKVSHLERSQQR